MIDSMNTENSMSSCSSKMKKKKKNIFIDVTFIYKSFYVNEKYLAYKMKMEIKK